MSEYKIIDGDVLNHLVKKIHENYIKKDDEALRLQEKTVNLSTVKQEITADEQYKYKGLSKLNLNDTNLEEKTVKSTNIQQEVYPSSGNIINKVTVEPVKLQEKTVEVISTTDRIPVEVTPDNGYDGLSKVTAIPDVNYNLQEKTVNYTAKNQEITPNNEYDGLSKITVKGYKNKLFTANSSSRVFLKNIVLTDDDLPENLTTLTITHDDGSLSINSNQLTRIDIPATKETIDEKEQYKDHVGDLKITAPNADVYVGEYACAHMNEHLVEVNFFNVKSLTVSPYSFYKSSYFEPYNTPILNNLAPHAFQNCKDISTIDLTNVVIDDLTSAESAFEFAKIEFNNITFGENITKICNRMFYNTSTTKITFPFQINELGESAFAANSQIYFNTLTIPATIKKIGNGCFEYCLYLETINIESGGITEIPEYCFAYIYGKGLNSMIIPEGITKIGKGAFQSTEFKTNSILTLPTTLREIGEDCFFSTSIKTELVIPEGITELMSRTFYQTTIPSIVLPNSLTTIHMFAFNSCDTLATLTLGPNIMTFQNGFGLDSCASLSTIYIRGDSTCATAQSLLAMDPVNYHNAEIVYI